MPPHNNKTFVIGKYIENLGEVRIDKTYILITVSEGITYKRLSKKNQDSFTVAPDNLIYSPYDIKLSDILEIWEYVAHIGRDDSKQEAASALSLEQMFQRLSNDMDEVKRRLS